MNVFFFIAAILSLIATAAPVHILCKPAKLKPLLTGIAFQPIRETDAIFGNENGNCNCNAQWYTIAALASMIIGLVIFIMVTTRKCRTFRGKLFSNTITVMLFFSDIKQYVPVKLCKTTGSIHLFKIFGKLTPDQITLERKLLLDVVKIDWREVFMTLNGIIIHLHTLVIIPLRDKFRLRCIMRKRSLLLHVLLRQETSWYALDNKEYLLPPPCFDDSEI